MNASLLKRAKNVEEMLDQFYVEVAGSDDFDERLLVGGQKRYFCRCSDDNRGTTSYERSAWLLLTTWGIYQEAMWHYEQGNKDDLVDCLLSTGALERMYSEAVPAANKDIGKRTRTAAANAKRRLNTKMKRTMRKCVAKSLKFGSEMTGWPVAEQIAREESTDTKIVDAKNVWPDIRYLFPK